MQTTYTVTEINNNINHILTANFTDISIEGEISSYKISPNGHLYFTLVDKTSELSCVMFSNDYLINKESIKIGKQVTASGGLGIYSPRGQYQFKSYSIKQLGDGDLWKKFELLKEKLQKEGLFEDNRKKDIPKYLKEVVIITSLNGSVKDDIIKIIKKRGTYQRLFIYPVSVQGKSASKEIRSAIVDVNNNMNPDVIIIARGGGSIEDLWAFNDEELARTISTSAIPIISAIGHESDFTIADFVSDKRASTPSDAAKIVSINQEDMLQYIDEITSNLNSRIGSKILFYREVVHNLTTKKIMDSPLTFIEVLKEKLIETSNLLKDKINYVIIEKKGGLKLFESNLKNLNPYNVINRGYSLLINEKGSSISIINDVSKGEKIYSKIKDGELKLEVLEKNEIKN